jgi:Bacterial capsule synthesis protein PGA_cap
VVKGRHKKKQSKKLFISLLVALIVLVVAGTTIVLTKNHVAPTTTTVPTTVVPTTVTISATGDMELGSTPQLPASPDSIFSNVLSSLKAQIEFGNLEGTLTTQTMSKCGASSTNCYAFRNPPSFANAFATAGFNVLNSANNHSNDFGSQGRIDTSKALANAGIAQAGLPGQIAVVKQGATSVAFVAFAPYYNTNNLLNFSVAKQLVTKAKREANIVVVYMHAGAEGSAASHVTKASESFFGENRGNPYVFAHAAIDDGADLVIASGPHVLRGMEAYHGHLINYSLGDFANFHNFATSGNLALSAILKVTLTTSGSFVSGIFHSVLLDSTGVPRIDPSHQAATFVNLLSNQDFGTSAVVIQPNGNISSKLLN